MATSYPVLVTAPASHNTIHAPSGASAAVGEAPSAVDPVQVPVNTGIPPTQFGEGYCDSGRRVKANWKQGRTAVIRSARNGLRSSSAGMGCPASVVF